MLSLPVCGTAHRVFCRSCPSIPSSRSRLRPKRNRPPHWARKTTWICSDNACYPDKRYPFSDTSQFLSIRTVKAAASQGNGGFLLLLRTLSSPRKIRSASDALAHASSLSASSLHSPQECFARSAFAASIADADMDRLVTPRPHSTGAMPAVPPSRRIRRLRYRSRSLLWPSWRSGAARPDAADGTGRKSSR